MKRSAFIYGRSLGHRQKKTTFVRLNWSSHLGFSYKSLTTTPIFCTSSSATEQAFCDVTTGFVSLTTVL